jgi:HlyD family secretion protein
MKKDKQFIWIISAGGIFMGIVLVFIIIGVFKPAEVEPIEGQVELTDYRISSKLPSRVYKLYVSEGDKVKKGDTLVVMKSPEIYAKLTQAESVHSAAEAIDEKANNGAREEQIRGAFEIWQQAKAGLEIAEKSYRRIGALYDEGVVSAQKRDELLANLHASQAREKAAKSQYDMAVNGARKEEKAAAKAQVNQAQGAVNEVKSYVNETVFTSPVDGYVTEIFPEIGELVGTGAPIMNVVDETDAWFTFNIREDKLPGIYVGRKMTVKVNALGRTIPVHISLMKDIGSFAVWKATKSTGDYDLKTFEVQARPQQTIRGLECGMSAILKN